MLIPPPRIPIRTIANPVSMTGRSKKGQDGPVPDIWEASTKTALPKTFLTIAALTLLCGVQAWSADSIGEDPAGRRKAQLEDIESAKANYVLKSKAFSHSNRSRALELIKSLQNKAGALSGIEFLLGIHKLAALADNGHDGVKLTKDAWR